MYLFVDFFNAGSEIAFQKQVDDPDQRTSPRSDENEIVTV
jgi:hypothetical protein